MIQSDVPAPVHAPGEAGRSTPSGIAKKSFLIAGAFFACLSAAASATAQPVNNACNAPTAISGTGTFPFTTFGGSTDGPSVLGCGPAIINDDVWFCWTAPATGQYTLSTCGLTTVDTVVAVYPGCACLSLAAQPLACNDDSCGLQSTVTWSATSGSTTFIRIGSFLAGQGGSGSFAISGFASGAANDQCSSATPLTGPATAPFDLTQATSDGPANTCGSGQIFNDVWYCWTAQQAGPVVISTCGGTAIDTVLAVYNGCTCGAALGPPIACSDDSCGSQSSLILPASAGGQYTIRLGGYGASTRGAGTLRIDSAVIAGPIVRSATGHAYYLLAPSEWSVAQAAAVSLGGHLATVSDLDENEFVRSQVLGVGGVDRDGWIGLNDTAAQGTFAWVSGEVSAYTNWRAGSPTGLAGDDYAAMEGASGTWRTTIDARVLPQTYGVVEVNGLMSTCLADITGIGGPPARSDGLITGDDFVAFISAFANNSALADVTGIGGPPAVPDGLITGDDFVSFIGSFATGCP